MDQVKSVCRQQISTLLRTNPHLKEGEDYFDCKHCEGEGTLLTKSGLTRQCKECNGYGLTLPATSPLSP